LNDRVERLGAILVLPRASIGCLESRLKRAWTFLAVLVAVGAAAGSASGSFPGRNGTIVYGWIGEHTYRAGPVATSILAVDPRTGLLRVLRDCPLQRGGPTTYADCMVSGPRVSPDGMRVAFPTTQVVVRPPAPWEYRPGLGLVASDGTGLEEHRSENSYGSLAWSPAGDRLLLSRQLGPGGSSSSGIYLASLDGTELSQVTSEGTGSPDWSSTGWIAFVRRSADPDCRRRCIDIWLTRLGEKARRLTYRGGDSPSWSPHGSKLAFVRAVDGRDEIYLVGRDGRGLRRLTHRGGYSPSWSPDGRWIAFVRAGALYVVRTTGGGRRRLVAGMREPEFGEGAQVTSVDWQALPRR
jgi:dipeptidyl aminopeptidase/acylaminoacyl peptidase